MLTAHYENGITAMKTPNQKKTKRAAKKLTVKIGPEPKVIARAEIIGGGPASVVIRFRARTGKVVKLRFARGDLHKTQQLLERLANVDCVLPLDSDARKTLQQRIASAEPAKTVRFSLTTGWVGNRFVLPDAIIGQHKSDDPKIAYEKHDDNALAKYDTSGTLLDWREKVAKLAGYSTTTTFAICLALAAPLLDVRGMEGGGIHLAGKSSKGKSTTARVAASVSGPPVLKTWSATINGIEAACCAFNGTLMCIDETGELDGTDQQQAQKIRQAAFKIASGAGKLRAGPGWNVDQKWRLFVLSSGEVSLEVIAAVAGGRRMAGEQIRFPNLPIRTGKQGVFEALPPGYTASVKIVNDLHQACLQHYGTALRAFLMKLTALPDRASAEIGELMQRFYDYVPVGDSDGWERRFAEKFALAAAAGILGVRWKVLPWPEELVLKSVKRCYRRARRAIPEAEQIINEGLVALDNYITDPTKVVDLRTMSPSKRKALKHQLGKGYIREWRNLGLHLAVKVADFRSWFKEPRNADLLLHELDRRGRLKRDAKRNLPTRQVQLGLKNEGKPRYLVVTIPEQTP